MVPDTIRAQRPKTTKSYRSLLGDAVNGAEIHREESPHFATRVLCVTAVVARGMILLLYY